MSKSKRKKTSKKVSVRTLNRVRKALRRPKSIRSLSPNQLQSAVEKAVNLIPIQRYGVFCGTAHHHEVPESPCWRFRSSVLPASYLTQMEAAIAIAEAYNSGLAATHTPYHVLPLIEGEPGFIK